MSKLTIIRGVSGSGKSTWARSQSDENTVVVSRDLIRLALVEDPSTADERLVTLMEDAMIGAALRAGRDVIVDDTNIQWNYVKRIANIGYALNAHVELKIFDVSLDQCLKNNAHRAYMGGRHVPNEVIGNQYLRFKDNKHYTLEDIDEHDN